MRQFPNHNHRDCENTLSFVAECSERGRSGSGLGMSHAEPRREGTLLPHQQLPHCWGTNRLFLFLDTGDD